MAFKSSQFIYTTGPAMAVDGPFAQVSKLPLETETAVRIATRGMGGNIWRPGRRTLDLIQ